MNEATLHGKPIKIGDKVWDSRKGWGVVKGINTKYLYSIETNYNTYMINGFILEDDEFPSLFWKEQKFDLSKPLPKLNVDDKVIVWRRESHKHYRHFCKFDSNDNIVTFDEGKTSWTSGDITSTWSNWELPDDTKGK